MLCIVVLLTTWVLVKGWLFDDGVEFAGDYGEYSFADDPVLGYRFKPCARFHSIKKVAEDTLYNVAYNINCNGTRFAGNSSGSKHLLFFGGSFTFGEGLNDTQTLPWLMGEQLPQIETYNLGGPGYGPQQMLSMLETGFLDTVVSQPEGMAVYVLLPEHVNRSAGSPYVIYYWGENMPCYQLEEDSLVKHHSFKTAMPFKTFWYKSLGAIGLMNFKSIAFPAIEQQDIDLLVAILDEARNTYKTHYPKGDFRVLCYPSEVLLPEYERIISGLQEHDIKLLDYRELFPLDSVHTISGDGHPTELTNREITKALSQDIGTLLY